MKKTFFLTGILLLILTVTGHAQVRKSAGIEGNLTAIVKKTLGKDTRIVRFDAEESSPLKEFRQVRVWIETPYGQTPVLFYVSRDRRFFVAGSIFDAKGNNLTAETVGKTRPRVLSDKEMRPEERYRIGPADAKVKVVLWLGMDRVSGIVFETLYEMYLKNKDAMSLCLKFYPKTERDAQAMRVAACGKNEKAFDVYRDLLKVAAGWGSPDDIEQFSRKEGFKDASCGDATIRENMEQEKTLGLPPAPVIFVNGTMLIEKLDKENIGSLAGTKLR